jgi:hypothetical protein
MDLTEIGARLEIEQALVRYCRGVDRGDAELIKSAFHPGAIDEHGPRVGTGDELAARLEHSAEHSEQPGLHIISNVYIEFDSETAARVETYVLAYHPLREPNGSETLLVFAGRYLDRFELREGSWRIAHRRVISDWHRNEPLPTPMSGYPVGRRGAGVDSSYELFNAHLA